MAGYDDHLPKKEQQQEKTIKTEQGHKLLPDRESVHITDQELIEKFDSRIENTTFEERTRYYFKDSDLMRAKVEKYRDLSKDKDAVSGYAEIYKNESAKKRRDAAADAAKSFEKAADLQDKEPADAKGLALYKHREKVLRHRMDGMVSAAAVKSQSKEDQTYRALKSRLSCLSILMDQLVNIQSKAPETEAESFIRERQGLEKEITKVKNKLRKKIPSSQSKWQQENNIDKDNFFTTGLELLDRENNLLEKTDEEKDQNFTDEGKGLYYVIKRDAQGNPVDKVELRKAGWNEKLRKAILEKDAETKDAMMIESMDRIEKISLPAPEDIKKNGIRYYLKKDNSGMLELINYGRYGLDSITSNDNTLAYGNRRRDLYAKFKAAEELGKIFKKEMKGKEYSIDEYRQTYDSYYQAVKDLWKE